MQPSNLQEVIQHIAQQQQAKVAADIAEAQHKIITISYDKAASYTTVIIFGGYAGCFAIWQMTKDLLTKQQAYWAALLLLISLLSFVLFEVTKMVLVTRMVMKKAKVLQLPEVQSDPARLLKELRGLDQAQHAATRPFMIGWAASVAVAVTCALGGAGVLAYAFLAGIAR